MTDIPTVNSNTTPTGKTPPEAVLPSGILIARRIQTFNSMQRAIESSAEALHEAWKDFQAAQQAPQAELKRTISAARIHVLQALTCLHPIESLIELNPEPLRNTYRCLTNCQESMRQIERVSRALIKTPTTPHLSSALSALARACPRASFELENNLGGPIRKARDEIAQLTRPNDALTA